LPLIGFTSDDLEAIVRVLAAVALLTTGGSAAQLAGILQAGAVSDVDLSNEKKYIIPIWLVVTLWHRICT
jgi:hypothetical protein